MKRFIDAISSSEGYREFYEAIATKTLLQNRLDSFEDIWSWHYTDFKIVEHTIRKFMNRGDKETVLLDIGCMGTPYPEITQGHTLIRYSGLDISMNSLKLMKDHYGGYGNHICGDIERLPIKTGSIDIIIATQVFEHLFDPVKALRESFRVLKQDGVLLISTEIQHYQSTPRSKLVRLFNLINYLRSELEFNALKVRRDVSAEVGRECEAIVIHGAFHPLYFVRNCGGMGFKQIDSYAHGSLTGSGLLNPGSRNILRAIAMRLLSTNELKIKRVATLMEKIVRKVPIFKYYGSHLVYIGCKKASI